MPIKATFGDFDLKQIVGYKISMGFQPRGGFNGALFIYIEQRLDSTKQLSEATVGEAGAPQRGTLTISGEERNYTFDNIDLHAIRAGVTQNERYRTLEFRYDTAIVDSPEEPNANIDVTNNVSGVIKEGSLKQDYKMSLDDGEEELLGFSSLLETGAGPVIRFNSKKNKDNSWVKKMVEVNSGRMDSEDIMPAFNVSFSLTDIAVNQDNLVGIFVDESYGSMLNVPLPSLRDVAMATQAEFPQVARINQAAYTPAELVEFDNASVFKLGNVASMTVETATLKFNRGNYRDLKVV